MAHVLLTLIEQVETRFYFEIFCSLEQLCLLVYFIYLASVGSYLETIIGCIHQTNYIINIAYTYNKEQIFNRMSNTFTGDSKVREYSLNFANVLKRC